MAEYWEKFRGGAAKTFKERKHVTISDKGVILLNRNVFRMIGSPEAVVLYFNRADCRIGVSPAHPQLAEAFPVKEKRGYWIIYASPFCRYFGIRIIGTESFVNFDVDAEGILRLDLTTTVAAVRRPRAKSAQTKMLPPARSAAPAA